MLPSRIAVALLQGRNTEAARLSNELFQRLKLTGSSRLAFSAESFLVVGVSHAMVGRRDLARVEIARVRENKLLVDGTADELVGLGALLDDRQLSESSLEAAIAHLRRVSLPEDRDKAERAIRGFAALSAGKNQEAYDLASAVGISDRSQRHTMFLAALAAMRLEQWSDAIRILEALRSWNYKLGTSALPATVRVMLGRAYAASGRPADARKAYDEAFTIWKNADADLPLLVEARKEYAALGS
jgi:tetratricopeptide (TPR) repeat protein